MFSYFVWVLMAIKCKSGGNYLIKSEAMAVLATQMEIALGQATGNRISL